jgi:hypothetical protein
VGSWRGNSERGAADGSGMGISWIFGWERETEVRENL